ITVRFATADETAIAGEDYEPTSGTLVFPPGVASTTISIRVRNDGVAGPDKKFAVNLFAPVNAKLGDGFAEGSIIEQGRTMLVEDTTTTEGDAPGVFANFPVSLSAPSAIPTTVRYTTTDGTALA